MKRILTLMSGILLIYVSSTLGGAYLKLDQSSLTFENEDQFQAGIVVSGSNGGCCTGMINTVNFGQENSIFEIKEKEIFPLIIEPGAKFEFTVLIKPGVRATTTDTVKIELTDPEGNFPMYENIIISYNNDLVANVTNNLSFELPQAKEYSVNIIDTKGRDIATYKVNSLKEISTISNKLPAGMHMISISAGNKSVVRKFLVTK